jgi:hypothetical protein
MPGAVLWQGHGARAATCSLSLKKYRRIIQNNIYAGKGKAATRNTG